MKNKFLRTRHTVTIGMPLHYPLNFLSTLLRARVTMKTSDYQSKRLMSRAQKVRTACLWAFAAPILAAVAMGPAIADDEGS
jgi:hypothetical protein